MTPPRWRSREGALTRRKDEKGNGRENHLVQHEQVRLDEERRRRRHPHPPPPGQRRRRAPLHLGREQKPRKDGRGASRGGGVGPEDPQALVHLVQALQVVVKPAFAARVPVPIPGALELLQPGVAGVAAGLLSLLYRSGQPLFAFEEIT